MANYVNLTKKTFNPYNPKVLNEGQFSWMTQDTDQQIGSERENTIEVWMYDNEGNSWYEKNYEGYGVFGGMDYYELLATMNGYTEEDLKKGQEMRGLGIDLAFKKLKTKDKGKKVLFPALVADGRYNWKRHDFTQEAEHDPNQSWYQEPEYEDEYDYDDEYYESVAMAINEWGSSDQNIFLDAIHKDAGKPKKMPSPFDSKLRAAAEDAVDFYWDDWDEYQTDRDGLVDDAVRSYLRRYFKKDFEMMQRMFEPMESAKVEEGKVDSPYQKADALANDMFGEFGLSSLDDRQLDAIIDLKKADKLAKKKYGEFGFKTLGEEEMEELLDANPKLLKESVNEARDWGTFGTPEAKKVVKALDKALQIFTSALASAHNDYMKAVTMYTDGPKAELGAKSGFHDTEGRVAVSTYTQGAIKQALNMQEYAGGLEYKVGWMFESKDWTRLMEDLGIDEGRSINKISKDHAATVLAMSNTAKEWKESDGDRKTELLDKLKELNKQKADLERELDDAVAGKDKNLQLSLEEAEELAYLERDIKNIFEENEDK